MFADSFDVAMMIKLDVRRFLQRSDGRREVRCLCNKKLHLWRRYGLKQDMLDYLGIIIFCFILVYLIEG